MHVITQAVEQCFLRAEAHFKQRFARPVISLQLSGKNAGMAHITQNKLRFNEGIYRLQPEGFVAQTVPHEVAHLVAYRVFGLGIKPHGSEWLYVMRQVFQQPANCTHTFILPSSSKPKKRYLYQCACATNAQHLLTGQRHALITQKNYRYFCRRCRAELRFIRATAVVVKH